MFRKDKKGQAAMEFLMTYGWAILAAIIAIGVLAYFGVFSPGKFVPSATVINAPLYANAWNVQATNNNVSIEVKNNGGDTINITGMKLSNAEHDGSSATCPDTLGVQIQLDPGDVGTVSLNCSTTFSAGKTFKADISIQYKKKGGSLELSSTGTIADKVV